MAKEVIDALVATDKHELVLLSRKVRVPSQLYQDNLEAMLTGSQDPSAQNESRPNVEWRQTDYRQVETLAALLTDVHTVLSFIDAMSDPENVGQRTLIDACVKAGIKRFAPSEWAM